MRVSIVALSVLFASPALAQDPAGESSEPGEPSRSYEAGDLGLDSVDGKEPVADPATSAQLGIGLNAALAPGSAGGAGVVTGFGLRLWLSQVVIEPIVGVGFETGDDGAFRMNIGAVGGLALATGNLRPIIGGGVTFAFDTGRDERKVLTFGPMFGVEYRFTELPRLAFDASLFLPFALELEPTVFRMQTAGAIFGGFHYYF
jgi:hypothetical protein